MKPGLAKEKSGKRIWMVESDKQSRSDIETVFQNKEHWNLIWFSDLNALLSASASENPMAILIDIEHFGQAPNSGFNTGNIEKIRTKFPSAEVLVFTLPEHEAEAAECLKQGAMDYIVVNAHQFVKLEYELLWLEDVLEERRANRTFITRLFILLGIMAALIALMIFLYEMGYLKEGNDPNILMGV
jgi:DNA-binding NtrC family response regulator